MAKFYEKAFWVIVVAVIGYSATRIDTMSSAMVDLSKSMAVIAEKVARHDQELGQHDLRLLQIEQQANKPLRR